MFRVNASRIVSLLALLAIVVCAVYLANFLNLREAQLKSWRARNAALTFADQLRQTSDDLTRMVRLYAVNGDTVYREYFDEILAIRNGEAPRPVDYFSVPYWDIVLNSGERFGEPGEAVPIRTLANRAGLLDNELALIEKAEDASNALAVIENEIMEVVAARIEAGGNYVLEGEALDAMLRLHGPEYFAAKAQVMTHLVELGETVTESFLEVRRETVALYNQGLGTSVILLAATLVIIAADILLQLFGRKAEDIKGSAGAGLSAFLDRRSRLLALLASLPALILVLLSVTFVGNFQRELPAVSRNITARLAARDFADNLRQTSDDLTLMVRLYAITGEPRYREYFDEILDIRNGIEPRPVEYFDAPYWDVVLDTGERPGEPGEAVPIRTLARNAGLLPSELAEFEKAEDASNALAELENEIMDVVAAQIEAGDGTWVLEGEALEAMLRLHGPEYHAAKALVMQPLVEVERLVDEVYATWLTATIDFNNLTLYWGLYVLIPAFVLLIVGLWLRRRQG